MNKNTANRYPYHLDPIVIILVFVVLFISACGSSSNSGDSDETTDNEALAELGEENLLRYQSIQSGGDSPAQVATYQPLASQTRITASQHQKAPLPLDLVVETHPRRVMPHISPNLGFARAVVAISSVDNSSTGELIH